MERFFSKEFGVATKNEWIYTDWNLPTGETEDSIGNFLYPWYGQDQLSFKNNGHKIVKIYHQLTYINPILRTIKLSESGTIHNRLNIVAGVISKFNFDDIKFFTEHSDIISYNSKSSVIKEKEKIKKMYDYDHLQWVLSPKTIERLLKKKSSKI